MKMCFFSLEISSLIWLKFRQFQVISENIFYMDIIISVLKSSPNSWYKPALISECFTAVCVFVPVQEPRWFIITISQCSSFGFIKGIWTGATQGSLLLYNEGWWISFEPGCDWFLKQPWSEQREETHKRWKSTCTAKTSLTCCIFYLGLLFVSTAVFFENMFVSVFLCCYSPKTKTFVWLCFELQVYQEFCSSHSARSPFIKHEHFMWYRFRGF